VKLAVGLFSHRHSRFRFSAFRRASSSAFAAVRQHEIVRNLYDSRQNLGLVPSGLHCSLDQVLQWHLDRHLAKLVPVLVTERDSRGRNVGHREGNRSLSDVGKRKIFRHEGVKRRRDEECRESVFVGDEQSVEGRGICPRDGNRTAWRRIGSSTQ
jgi:hypothetical protein